MSNLMDFERKNEGLVAENYFRLIVIEKILEIMESKGISQTELAKKMNLSKSQVSRLISDDRNLTLSSISKIFNALGEEPTLLSKSEVNNLSKIRENAQLTAHLQVSYYDSISRTGHGKASKHKQVKQLSAYNKINFPQVWGKV